MDTHDVPAGSIVVGIDGSAPSSEALSWAIDQAALEARPLTLVHCLQPAAIPAGGGMYAGTGIDYGLLLDDIREAGQSLLSEAATRASDRHPDLHVHRVLGHADPRSTLLHLGENAAMIVIGSRGRGPVASLLLGSVSVSVAKHAACPVVVHRPTASPVVVHRPTASPSPASASGDGILVGFDGSADSLPVIDFAYRMASSRELPLTVMHCSWDAGPVGPLQTTGSLAQPDVEVEQALMADSLARMAEKFPEVAVHVRLAHGFAAQQLVTASEGHDLLVIGHRATSAVGDLVHDSVAAAVVEHAHGVITVVPCTVRNVDNDR